MAFKGIQDIIPDGQIELLEHGRTEEIEQGLFDLGYLENNLSLQKGIALFRKEYREMGLIPDYNRYNINFQNNELDPVELNLLHSLIALDGDFVIQKLPAWESSNLCTRVIHYRLEALGLYEGQISDKLNLKARHALHDLAGWLHLSQDLLPLILLIGDIPELIKKVHSGDKLKSHIVCFKYENPTNESTLIEEINEEAAENEDEDEDQLVLQEAEIDKGLQALELKISEKQKETIEDFDLRQNTKTRRQKRVDKLQSKIEKTRTKGNLLYKKRLNSIEKENVELAKLQKLIEKITKENQAFSDKISAKETQLKVVKHGVEQTQKAQGEIKKFQKKLKIKYKHLSNPQFQNLVTQQEAEVTMFNKTIDRLKITISKIPSKKKRRPVIAQLNHSKEKRDDSQDLLKNLKKEWQVRASIQDKVTQIKGLEDELAKTKSLSAEITSLSAQLIIRNTELKEIIRAKNKSQKGTDKIIIRIKREQETHQLKILGYKNSLDELLRKINNLNFRFKAKLSRSLTDSYYKEIKLKVFTERNTSYLDKRLIHPFNQFLIRLIQVHQWTNGYYYGKLDSDLSHRSFDSIADLVEDIPRLRLKYILTLLGSQTKGYWILNVAYLFNRLVELLKEDPKKYTAADVFKKYEKEMNTKQHKVTVVEKAWTSYTKEIKEGLKQPSKIRRIYYGIRSLARSIMRCFVRLIRFIIRGIKKLITLFKNFIKLLYKEIREGVRKFKQGIGFLFGRRQLETIDAQTGKIIITKYDFDFDTHIIAPSSHLPEAIYWKHHQKCLEYTHNLDFSMVLLGKILNWIWNVSKGPLGWAKLAIRIAIYFKNLVIDWLKRKRREVKVLALVFK